jgi:hypothetical protein
MNFFKPITGKSAFVILVILFTTTISKVTFGQVQEGSVLLGMTEMKIKAGHDTKFREGVKAWKTCYVEKGGTWHWDVWRRFQGEGAVYVLTSVSPNWADFDESDEAGLGCRDIARELINPNIESSKYSIARTMPANSSSKPWSLDSKVVLVNYWDVKNTQKFMEAVNEVHSALRQQEGDVRSYWYTGVGGGPNDFNYIAVTPYANFAQLDETRPGVWAVVEGLKGKRLTDKTRETLRESLNSSWSYIYRLVEDISRRPAAETAAQ